MRSARSDSRVDVVDNKPVALELDVPLEPRLTVAASLARDLEVAGYRTIWVPETSGNPFLAAAVALEVTSSTRVGTGIAVAFARSPFVTAQSAWQLAGASGGRFVLGLGTQVKGHAQHRFSMPWSPPVARLREYVEVVRACWQTFLTGSLHPVSGEFYRFDLLPPVFDPGPIDHPTIDVHLAGVNHSMVSLAGEIADGLVAHPLHTRAWLEETLLPALHQGLARTGRSRAAFRVEVPVWVISGRGEALAEQRAKVRREIAFYGSTRTYRTVFEGLGRDDLPGKLHRCLADGDSDGASALVPDEVIDAVAVVCDPGDEVEALAARYGGLVDACILWPPTPWPLAGLEAAQRVARLSALMSA